MPNRSLHRALLIVNLAAVTFSAQAQDLNIKKSIAVGGNVVSTTETSIKGARERSVSQGSGGGTITLRQCDLKRTLTLNDRTQTYLVTTDPQDENAERAAAFATGAAAPDVQGGKITMTTTLTDTGERKTLYGYPARHLKAKIVEESSADACTQIHQSFDIDGWFADVTKEQSACATIAPPVRQTSGCSDRVIARRVGSGKLGYPLQESITIPSSDGSTTIMTIQVSELTRQELPAEMFDVPAGYRQVNSAAELSGAAPQQQVVQQQPMAQPPMGYAPPQQTGHANRSISAAQMLNPMAGPGAQAAANQMAYAQMQMLGAAAPNMAAMTGGMPPGMGGNQPAGSQVAAPQPLGPKAPGKIRIGVAPPDAQVGQGSNTGADYSTPIRNAEIALMSGPAIEIAALDSHVAMQLQAEAQQKQCDYILFSSVAVKHGSGGGFGKFMKMGSMAASMTPMGAMAHGMGGAMAAQTIGMAASQMAQQQAMDQLAGFNGQIKSKDDVTVQYQLVATGQSAPLAQNSLQGKAKSDGEDVLTPLLQQAATAVLTQVSQK